VRAFRSNLVAPARGQIETLAGLTLALTTSALAFHYALQVSYNRFALLSDIVIFAYASCCVSPLLKDGRAARAIVVVLCVALQVASLAKSSLLGASIDYADLRLLAEACKVVPRWTLVAAAVFVVLGLVVMARAVRPPSKRRAALGLMALLAPALAVSFFPLELHQLLTRVGVYDPYERSFLGRLGVVGSFVVSYTEAKSLQRQLDESIATLPFIAAEPRLQVTERRNLYIILMESLTDPTEGPVRPRMDPIDHRVRARIGGAAVAGVFGGGSAQSEFEILCGEPAMPMPLRIVYLHMDGSPVACLPRRLAELGYITRSFVAVDPNFFNAGTAYRSMGFSESYFLRDFPKDLESDSDWMPTEGYSRLVKPIIRQTLAEGVPQFNFIFTVSSHMPYAVGASRHPGLKLVEDRAYNEYLNSIAVNTREVADLIDWIESENPDATIIVTGDHHPPLDRLLVPASGDGPNDVHVIEWLHRVPLVYIQRGQPRRDLGVLPHYLITTLIENDLAGRDLHAGMPRLLLRPITDDIYYLEDGELQGCRRESPSCVEARLAAADAASRLIAKLYGYRARHAATDTGLRPSR
jgi:hypothetical protein